MTDALVLREYMDWSNHKQ